MPKSKPKDSDKGYSVFQRREGARLVWTMSYKTGDAW